MIGFTENFWVACAEAIKVSALKAGLVSTLPQLISSAAQSTAGKATEKLGGKLNTLKRVIVVQWLSLLPLLFLPLLQEKFRYLLLMSCAILFSVGGALPGPAWLSLMSDHLPSRSIGKYFGWRNRILGMITLGCGLCAGQILQAFKTNVLWGFSLIFGLAFVCRFSSWSFLIRMYEPKIRNKENENGNGEAHIPDSFFKFVRNDSEHHFVRFAFFVACFTFAVNIIGPYLAIYMLRDLHFPYSTFTYVTFAATLTSIFGVKIWGELSDQFGNLRVVQATSIFISIVPILWFISAEPVWLVLVNAFAGFVWSGFQLCIMTFAFSEVPAAMRTRAIGYLAALNGTAVFLGSYLGGSLLKVLPLIRHSAFGGLFLISGLLRISAAAYFLKNLKEIRASKPISTIELYAGALGLDSFFQSGKEIWKVIFREKKK